MIKDQFSYSVGVKSRMKVKQGQRQLQGKPPLGIDEQVYRLIYVTQFEVSDAQGTTFPSVSFGVLFLCSPAERKCLVSLSLILGEVYLEG